LLAIERLKLSTRQYSKYQEKWLRMRLLQRVEEHSPDVYELDTTDLSLWHENVEQRAEAIIDAFLKVINFSLKIKYPTHFRMKKFHLMHFQKHRLMNLFMNKIPVLHVNEYFI
jgi:tRNA dimethylallyltransferase